MIRDLHSSDVQNELRDQTSERCDGGFVSSVEQASGAQGVDEV